MDTEVLWIVVKSSPRDLAVGLDKPALDSWNKEIFENLQKDIAELKSQGKKILLLGDFNSHITRPEITGTNWKTDKNGERLVTLMKQEDLEIINFLQKCKGEWTWMRGKNKSIIDYVMADKDTTNNIMDMKINERAEKWSIGTTAGSNS